MRDEFANHAMTEIALALAMAFFTLLILALVSMGAGAAGPTNETPGVAVAESRPGALGAANPRRILIWHRGTFLDPETLIPVVPQGDGPFAVAVDPETPLAALMDLRRRLAGRDVLITAQTPAWRAALAHRKDIP
ncbi:MAG: hypothetical protein HQ495_00195 [Alphaproteobacteria bacterium]|nr:hypothetical protein [Alphaproteobacteria bacterium]